MFFFGDFLGVFFLGFSRVSDFGVFFANFLGDFLGDFYLLEGKSF